MFDKNKRILWLLNHKTLMPYEAPLIQRLGFEIYIPKIFPKTGFRSGAVDASYDAALSLPRHVLAELNRFNFYEDTWTPKIVTLLNRYFGCVFIIPHGKLSEQAIDNFEGQIVFRAFGLENGKTYKYFLESLHGPLVLRKIRSIKQRFWFGEGYDHLNEIEEPLFAERSLFLPIGIPDSFFSTARQWKGTEKKILFVCPNAVSDSYYSGIYRKFKEDFGDLPHVIVGAQDVPMDDTHVTGFVTNEELNRLYLECAVLYYHSVEIRHVHYSPVEAAINGMPVIFFEGSLLDRLSRGATKGRVSTVAEARKLVERILADDQQLITEITQDQQEIAYHFSDAYCGPMWKQQMEDRGFFEAMRQESTRQSLWSEIKRTLMRPFAHGRLAVNPHKEAVAPMIATLSADEARQAYGASLFDGISFSTREFPEVIDFVDGVSASEPWGRWSIGEKIVIVLKHKLEGKFRFYLHAVGYLDNAGVPVPVRIGNQTRTAQLGSDVESSTPIALHFDLKRPANVIEITVPHPVRPPTDSRTLGIGMVAVSAAPAVELSMADARQTLGSTLEDGWDFSAPGLPAFVDSVQGLYAQEAWGRWSQGDKVVIELKHALQGRFTLLLRAAGLGRNARWPIKISVGGQSRRVRVKPAPNGEVAVTFDLARPACVIEIHVPFPTELPTDIRKLGVAFYSMRIGTSQAS